MKALILNSGMGTRMGDLTSKRPKCMTEIWSTETILSRQLKMFRATGIRDIIMTTGFLSLVLEDYCKSLKLDLNYNFVYNRLYASTNYIFSIYLARQFLEGDIVMVHGDMVFEQNILEGLLAVQGSCMTVSSVLPLPKKDFKAVIDGGKIKKIGVEFFKNAVTAQPFYKLDSADWKIWLASIVSYCEQGRAHCYAETALNEVLNVCHILPLDFKEKTCMEIDDTDDLILARRLLQANEK